MADLSFGSTFQPGANTPPWMRPGGYGGAGAGFSPVQQAVQVLSLRLPQVFGSQAPLAHELASGGQYSQTGPTQGSAVGQTYMNNRGGAPATGGYQPPPPIAGPKFKIPGIPGYQPGEAANLGQVLSQLPQNVPPPNISMIAPGPSGGLPTQISQLSPAQSYAPPQSQNYGPPLQSLSSGYQPYGGGYSPGFGVQSPYFKSPY